MSDLLAGVSGMIASQASLDQIGDNIANVNTVGYKSSSTLFADELSQLWTPATAPTGTLGGTNPLQVGQGVLVAGSDLNLSQGSLQATGRSTDVAIQGNGMIAVTDGSQIYYTRDGQLGMDANGNLVQLATGMKVVGLGPGATGNANPSVSASSTLQVPIGQTLSAQATSTVDLTGNLDSRTASGGSEQVTAQVYDSLGNAHSVTLTFSHSGDGQWTVSGSSPDGSITVSGNAQAAFDANGAPTGTPLSLQFALTTPGGAQASYPISLDLSKMTQLADSASASLASQNGAPAGTLTGISIQDDGTISGVFSNGLTRSLGQIVTATFPNPGGLENHGGNLFEISANSGAPSYGAPGSSGHGTLQAGELESSNVDLTQQFADMILSQRGFQASSRVVTTADQLLQSLLQVIQ